MSGERSDNWQQLLDYSRLMLEKAEAGEWDALPAMATERQSRLESFFAEPVPAGLADQVAKGIHQIGDIDAAITAMAKTANREFSAEHDIFKKRKQASEAYSDPRHGRRN